MNRKTWLIGWVAPVAVLALSAVAPVQAREPDALVTTRVKMALILSMDISAMPIDVDTFDGRVTLHGKVSSQAERDQAEKLARTVGGATDVRNLLQVVDASHRELVRIEDAQLRKRIETALRSDRRLAHSRIRVKSVNRGLVLMNGRASTLSDHLLALEIAARTPGVNGIASEIQSPDAPGDDELWYGNQAFRENSSVGDAWITARTKFRFMADADLPAGDIHVDTRDGAVTLFGTAPTDAVRDRAAALAMSVSGVKSVRNDLSVVAPENLKRLAAEDHRVAAAVSRRIADADLPDADIHVEVRAAVARLTGRVTRPVDRYDAILIARATNGVVSVRDELQLEQ